MPADHSDTVRRTVYYSGRVQGVGFRYTTRDVAAGFAVVGFVKNLEDGRVELVVEGAAAELDRLQAEIAARMGRNIQGASAENSPARGEFAKFEIRY